MVQVTNNNTLVSGSFTKGSNGSVTVPSGEVWKVTISGETGGNGADQIQINGNTVMSGEVIGNSQIISFQTVLVGNDTLQVSDQASLYYSGRKVGDEIDNQTVTESIDDGSSVTVPSGETWSVNIAYQGGGDASDNVTIDGAAISSGSSTQDTLAGSTHHILPEGTTISSSGSGSAYIGGFVI